MIGMISGLLVVASVVPYMWRTWQGKIKPNVTSWGLWSLIGLALLLTFKSSGAQSNLWPAIFGFVNPVLVFTIALNKKGERTRFGGTDWWCVIICIGSLGLWAIVQHDKNLAQYAVYLALVADVVAAIPTLKWVSKHPEDDRPFAWCAFGFAYGLSLFAIAEHTFVNYAVPIYMLVASGYMAWQLTKYRIKNLIPLKEWI